ncbi:MAG: Na/Pi symporter [Candidatus Delongbacteria bacterium]
MSPSPPPATLPLSQRLLRLAIVLFLFFVSIEWMAESFKLFGSGLTAQLLNLTSNPFTALFVGILTTSIVQSSSATTSMVVALVAAGSLQLPLAVPIIMGANIGTSITNTLVSLAHINRSAEFRRAFAASTVHDIFNLLCVLLFFPLELATGVFSASGLWMARGLEGMHGLDLMSPLKLAIHPVASGMIHLLESILPADTWWHPHAWLSLALALTLLFGSILFLTNILKSLALQKAETWFEDSLFKSTSRSFLIGLGLTMAVQSSSVTTSLIVPMAGAGLLSLRQIYPYTLGANIGTTITALMAALATQNPLALAIALVHTLFNAAGTAVFLPLRAVPIYLASRLADVSMRSRVIPFAYVLTVFFLIPVAFIFLMD